MTIEELKLRRMWPTVKVTDKETEHYQITKEFLKSPEKMSFYKDANGNDIVFDGGVFELNL